MVDDKASPAEKKKRKKQFTSNGILGKTFIYVARIWALDWISWRCSTNLPHFHINIRYMASLYANIVKDAIDFVHSSNIVASNSRYHIVVVVANASKSIFAARKTHCSVDGLTFVNPRYANFPLTITNVSMVVFGFFLI